MRISFTFDTVRPTYTQCSNDQFKSVNIEVCLPRTSYFYTLNTKQKFVGDNNYVEAIATCLHLRRESKLSFVWEVFHLIRRSISQVWRILLLLIIIMVTMISHHRLGLPWMILRLSLLISLLHCGSMVSIHNWRTNCRIDL